MAKYESDTSFVVEGFKTEAECRRAGEKAKELAQGYRSLHFVCVQRTK